MKYFITTVTLLIFNSIVAQNFEGIILYKRLATSGKIAFETYYFGKNHLRIDSDFVFEDGIKKYIGVYSFKDSTNVYQKYDDGICNIKTRKGGNSIMEYKPDLNTAPITVIDHETEVYAIKYKPHNVFGATNQIFQKRYVSNELKYKIPEGWVFDWVMVTELDDRIVLKLEERYENSEYLSTGGYTREAIYIRPMKLSEEVFVIKECQK
jgi:hypothetical protein